MRYIFLVIALLSLTACAVQVPTADDDPSLGDSDAPITIIAFEDFQCDYCKQFNAKTFDRLKKEYIDSGKVRFIYRDFIGSSHPNARRAALAAQCAYEQGKFWQYHDILFENQQALDTADLIRYARVLVLDEPKFTQCLESEKYASEVLNDDTSARKAGVIGTPTFFIKGKKVVGAQSFAFFEEQLS